MNNVFFACMFISVILLNVACNSNVKEAGSISSKDTVAAKTVWESEEYGLDEYFKKHEIQPAAVFYNIYDASEVAFFNHRIKWMNNENDIQLNIDGNVFSLEKEVTLNAVWNDGVDSVNFVNDWDEMKYYKSKDYELIGIRMHFNPCNGSGCSANYFLWYDLKNKTENYFGTFRTDNKLALYSFNNNESINYLSGTFIGDAQGATEMNFVTEVYTLNDKGIFVLQKDSDGNPYQIVQTTFPNDTTIAGDKVRIHWFENINE